MLFWRCKFKDNPPIFARFSLKISDHPLYFYRFFFRSRTTAASPVCTHAQPPAGKPGLPFPAPCPSPCSYLGQDRSKRMPKIGNTPWARYRQEDAQDRQPTLGKVWARGYPRQPTHLGQTIELKSVFTRQVRSVASRYYSKAADLHDRTAQ